MLKSLSKKSFFFSCEGEHSFVGVTVDQMYDMPEKDSSSEFSF